MQDTPKSHHIDRRADAVAEAGAGNPDDLLDTTEVHEWIGYSTQWLEIARSRGYGPRFVRLGPKRVRYRRADVLAWLRERTYQSTAEYSRCPTQEAP